MDRMIEGYENPNPIKKARRGRGRRSMRPSPLSSPKEITGRHGHRPHGPSIRWPALYEHLRAKGMTKRKAAMISNGQWRKKRGLPPKSVKGTKGMVGLNKTGDGLSGKPYKLYYFQGRNTGIAARSVEEARQKKKRGGDKLMGVRTPTPSEKSQMERGIWVRTRLDGKSPEKSSMGHGRGFGPPRVKKGHGPGGTCPHGLPKSKCPTCKKKKSYVMKYGGPSMPGYKCKFGLDPSECDKCPFKIGKMMPAPTDVLSPEPLKSKKRRKMTRKERKSRMEQLVGSDIAKSLKRDA